MRIVIGSFISIISVSGSVSTSSSSFLGWIRGANSVRKCAKTQGLRAFNEGTKSELFWQNFKGTIAPLRLGEHHPYYSGLRDGKPRSLGFPGRHMSVDTAVSRTRMSRWK
jgi:hypothetical protein